MKPLLLRILCILAFGIAATLSAEEGQPSGHTDQSAQEPSSDTPTYAIHDINRPQPRRVASGGALVVAPPSDATILFDGTTTEAWEGSWIIADGILIATKGGPTFTTRESFRDCQLHLEWRIPAGRKVRGQKGGNSGVFLMGLYEVQILESARNETYPDGQAGALYGQFPPLVNASRPQGEWQSYDIIFKAPVYTDGAVTTPAQVTVIHNGVVVQAAQNYRGPSAHKRQPAYPAKHPEAAPLSLQWHGDPIEFRNIWIRPLGDYDQR